MGPLALIYMQLGLQNHKIVDVSEGGHHSDERGAHKIVKEKVGGRPYTDAHENGAQELFQGKNIER